MNHPWTRSTAAALLLLVGLRAPSVQAQISGAVHDTATHAPVADAIVTARALGLKTVTNSSGEFSFSASETGGKTDALLAVAAVGYYIASVQAKDAEDAGGGVEVQLEKVPIADSPDWEFPPADSCHRCHESIYQSWRESPMAHAGLNTWTHDLYSGEGTPGGMGGFVYKRDSKFASTNPNSECAACHEPELWARKPGVAMVTDSHLDGVMHGISCSVCHRIASIDVTKTNFPGLHSASVKMSRPAPGQDLIVQYGPLPDVTFERLTAMRPSYQPQIQSEVCGACHQDKNDPDQNGNFEEENGVISEPTYLEWAASSYADRGSKDFQTCAGCHMEVSDDPSACSEVTPDPPRAHGELRKHTFEGTTPKFLENAVTMSMQTQVKSGELQVQVSIHNDKTGHHVPTGVTIRNMILLVEATRMSDGTALKHTGQQVIHDLGGVGDPKQGYFAGLPGKLFAKINNDENGKSPVFFSEAIGIVSDNRIPAGVTDTSEYSFAMPNGDVPVQVRARLIYRRSWRAVVDAKKWTQDGHGNPLEDIAAPNFGHLMAEQVAQIGKSGDAGCTGASCVDAVSTDAGSKQHSKALADAGRSKDGGAGKTDDGCGCRLVGANDQRTFGPAATLLVGLAAWLRRRKRQSV
jgi:MYXO-CTERM domain-containing protein